MARPMERQVGPGALVVPVRTLRPVQPFLWLRFAGLTFAAQSPGRFLARFCLGSLPNEPGRTELRRPSRPLQWRKKGALRKRKNRSF